MLSKKTRRIIASLLVGITVFVGACISCFNLGKQQTPHSVPQQIEQKVDYSESVVEQLEAVNRIEVYEAYLKNDVTIKQGYDNSFFRNNKELKIPSTGIYRVDMDNVHDNVIVNGKEVTVIASMEYNVTIHEDRIQFTDDRGFLVFYNVQITPEEQTNIMVETKNKMLAKMQEAEYLDVAKAQAEAMLANQLRDLGCTVKVIWR